MNCVASERPRATVNSKANHPEYYWLPVAVESSFHDRGFDKNRENPTGQT